MIIVVGASGQLGSALCVWADQKKIPIKAFDRAAVDITDQTAVRALFSLYRPKFLINAAAFTAVDLAETEPASAMRLNAEAPKQLAELCALYDCVFIHPSTDYVFDGCLTRAYRETDVTNPINVYGESKLLGEQLIAATHARHIILRVSWVFGIEGKNFVKTILRLAQNKTECSIVNDQQGCPTAAVHIAAVIFDIIAALQNGGTQSGLYHYCDQPVTSWYEFALRIIEEAKKEHKLLMQKIIPISTAQFPTPARRPRNSELDCTKIMNDFGMKRFDWQEALVEVICRPAALTAE